MTCTDHLLREPTKNKRREQKLAQNSNGELGQEDGVVDSMPPSTVGGNDGVRSIPRMTTGLSSSDQTASLFRTKEGKQTLPSRWHGVVAKLRAVA